MHLVQAELQAELQAGIAVLIEASDAADHADPRCVSSPNTPRAGQR